MLKILARHFVHEDTTWQYGLLFKGNALTALVLIRTGSPGVQTLTLRLAWVFLHTLNLHFFKRRIEWFLNNSILNLLLC